MEDHDCSTNGVDLREPIPPGKRQFHHDERTRSGMQLDVVMAGRRPGLWSRCANFAGLSLAARRNIPPGLMRTRRGFGRRRKAAFSRKVKTSKFGRLVNMSELCSRYVSRGTRGGDRSPVTTLCSNNLIWPPACRGRTRRTMFTLGAAFTTRKVQARKSHVFHRKRRVFCTNSLVLSGFARMDFNQD